MKVFSRTSTYLWLLVAVLFALLVRPYTVEIIGMWGGATERPGVVSSTESESYYHVQDNYTSYSTIYTFKDSEGNTYHPASFSDLNDLHQGDHVTLGIVDSQLATVNGTFVGQVGFLERLGFGFALALIVFARTSQRFERYAKHPAVDTPWLAAIVTLFMLLPATPVGFVVTALSFAGEALGIALWPLIMLALAAIIGQLLCWRMDKKRA